MPGDHVVDGPDACAGVGEVELRDLGRPARSGDLRGDFARRGAVDVADHDGGPLARQTPGDRGSDTAARAGDDTDLLPEAGSRRSSRSSRLVGHDTPLRGFSGW